MDVQNISQKQMRMPFQGADYQRKRQRVKDSLLLVIVFLIGLIGSCYILHFALSTDSNSTSYDTELTVAPVNDDLALK